MGHVPVMLHNLLDDLILLVVEYSRAEVVLHFVLKDGVFLAFKRTQIQKAIRKSLISARPPIFRNLS